MGLSSSFVKLLCTFTFFCLAKAIDTFEQQCSSFKPQTYIHNSTLQILEYVPAGTNLTFSYNVDSCNRGSQVVSVDICRIALTIPTSNRSSITYEQWLPRNWTGRFLATGNGGIDGCKSIPQTSTKLTVQALNTRTSHTAPPTDSQQSAATTATMAQEESPSTTTPKL